MTFTIKKVLLGCLLLLSLNAGAQVTLYVDSSVAASGAGTSWLTAYKTLTEAMNAYNGSTAYHTDIRIAKGTYYPPGQQSSTGRNATYLISHGQIAIYGGYPTGGGVRNVAANPVILSGDIGVVGTKTDNTLHIISAVNFSIGSDTSVIDGLTLRDAYDNIAGGAQINGQTISTGDGGAIISYANSGIRVNDCTFNNNYAVTNGGAIYNEFAYLDLRNCNFTDNNADTLAGAKGGALDIYNCRCDISNCTFTHNSGHFGGAVFSQDVNMVVTGCTFNNNRASYYGGGVYYYYTNYTFSSMPNIIKSCSFTGNSAVMSGGGVDGGNLSGPGGALIYLCSFTGNRSPDGGAIHLTNYGSSTAGSGARRCTFTQNRAKFGGGVSLAGGGVPQTADSSTFIGNKADSLGGAIYCYFVPPASNTTTLLPLNYNRYINDTAVALGGAVFTMGRTTLGRSAFLGNYSVRGGAVYNYGSYSTFPLDTFSGNIATASGGAMYNFNTVSGHTISSSLLSGNKAALNGGAVYDSTSVLSVVNCTMAGDTAASGNGIYNNTSSLTVINSILWDGANTSLVNTGTGTPAITYSNVQGGYTGTGNLSSDPLFVAPPSAAGAPSTGGNYQLLICSPAINSGTNTSGTVGNDLAGGLRLIGATIDRGAYEYPGTLPPPITGNSTFCANTTLQLSNLIPGGTWSSSNTAVATVSNTGLVSGVAGGSVTITYVSNNGTCSFTSTKALTVGFVPTVQATSGLSSLCANATLQLTNLTPSGGTWSSSTPSVATVSPVGLVTAVAPGTDTVFFTVTNTGGCSNAAIKIITVNGPTVAALTGNDTVCGGSTITLSSTTTGGVWSSANAGIASVSGGIVTGVAAGTVVISYTVTDNSGCSTVVHKSITVKSSPSMPSITGNSGVCPGNTVQLSASAAGGIWNSGNTGIATVSQTGLVTPVAAGTTTVTYAVSATNGCSSTATKPFAVGAVYNNVAATGSTCAGVPYAFGGQSYSNAGTYTHVFQTALGCDSNVTLTLTVVSVNAGISQTGNTLSAQQSGAAYQWVDCANGNSPIAGATAQSFTPVANGQYAVQVSQNGCTETSACKTITGLSVAGPGRAAGISVFPNPAGDIVTINTGSGIARHILLRDVAGKVMAEIKPAATTSRLDVSHLAAGIYFLEVWDAGGSRVTANVVVAH